MTLSIVTNEFQRIQPHDFEENDNVTYENKETITLIWFDKNLTSNMKDIELTKSMLREINNFVLFFSDVHACIEHIEKIKMEIIFLVMSGSDADAILSKVHSLRQVDLVFIFCADRTKHEAALNGQTYHKIVGVYIDQNSLIHSLQDNIQLAEKQQAVFNLYNQNQRSIHNLTKESGAFIWQQLLKEVLQKMHNQDQNDKEEMLAKCRLYYRGNNKELRNIDEFERTYSADKAIAWYTRDSFLYKLINKAMRTEDVEALYTFRFYLIDLTTQLADNHQLMLEYGVYKLLTLYRGTKMSHQELDRLKDGVNHLISTNGFLSTSKDRKVAELYAGLGVAQSKNSQNDLVSVIFEIKLDLTTQSSTIVADIMCYSRFKEEEEFLFDLGAVFEIEDIFFNEHEKCWVCKLVSSDKGLQVAKEYLDYRRDEIKDENSDIFALFGDLIFDMGEYHKCRQYFENLINITHGQPSIDIYYGLGTASMGLGEFQTSLNYLQQAYDMCVDDHFLTKINMIRILMVMGFNYDSMGDNKSALDRYFTALEIAKTIDRKKDIARLLMRIGGIYYNEGLDDECLKYLQESYTFLTQCVPTCHPAMAEYYYDMGRVYYHIGQYDQALDNQMKCFEIERKLFPYKHLHISNDMNNLGKYNYKKRNYQIAMQYLVESLQILRSILKNGDDYYSLCFRINSIGKCHHRLKNYTDALRQYETMMELMKRVNLTEHVHLAYTLKNFGEVYFELKNFDLALDYYNQALDMYKKIFKHSNHSDVAKCLNLIGEVYDNMNDDDSDKCLSYYMEAQAIWRNVLPPYHPNLALCYKNIAAYYLHKQNECDKARYYCTLSRRIYERTVKQDHPELVEVNILAQSIVHHQKKIFISDALLTLKLLSLLFLFAFSLWF